MTQAIVPSSAQPIADRNGKVTTYWQRFFNALVGPANALAPVVVGASPFAFTAPAAGFLNIFGGTVSSTTLTRNNTTVSVNTPTPMTNGDIVTITYSVLPTVTFIPS